MGECVKTPNVEQAEEGDSLLSALTSLVRHFRELGFTVVAHKHSHKVEFSIYDIEEWEEGTKSFWHRAEPYLHGRVRWDGCSDWYFDEQDRAMLHGCCKADVQRIGDIMAACWEWASVLLVPKFDA